MPHWFDAITDKFVRNVANRYMVETGIDAFRVIPEVSSTQLSGYIANYTLADWLKIGNVEDYKRLGAVESVGDDYAIGKQSYTLEEFAFHKDISKDDRNDYDNPYDPVRDAVDFVLGRIKRVVMQNMVDTFLKKNVWGTDKDGLDGGDFTVWDNDSATPVADVLGWQMEIQKTTGYKPNKMIMAPDVFTALKTSSDITAKMKTTSDKVVTIGMLAKLFELEDIQILDAVNSDGDNFVFANSVLLLYTPNRASKFAPSAAYNIVYRNKRAERVGTRRIPMPEKNDALRIEAWIKTCPKIISSDLGLFADHVLSWSATTESSSSSSSSTSSSASSSSSAS
ncbi:MAG TPA: hypothetical protein EYP19_11720 [Desulfobacterales bacterium]|nr:hypothetical protein [Desulfobacterales bacterium]